MHEHIKMIFSRDENRHLFKTYSWNRLLTRTFLLTPWITNCDEFYNLSFVEASD